MKHLVEKSTLVDFETLLRILNRKKEGSGREEGIDAASLRYDLVVPKSCRRHNKGKKRKTTFLPNKVSARLESDIALLMAAKGSQAYLR